MMEPLMLDEFMKVIIRKPTPEELKVIKFLVEKANYKKNDWEKELNVIEMPDGMGSLLLIPEGLKMTNRMFKKQISDILFKDIDGVDVIVSLNIDQEDFLYELDVWKMNYEKVKSYGGLYTKFGII